MKLNPLGRSDLLVSEICLGSMTWGSQNSQDEANQQLDYAVGEGVNFIDTAEMYPTTPRRAETTGHTEEILGNWLQNHPDRSSLVVATKVTGEGNKDVRGGARVTGQTIREALEASLIRLKTDYVDLYQLHWPNRGSYHFRKVWHFDPTTLRPENMDQEVADMLGEVQRLQSEGKLRSFGLSNESAWGTMKFLQVSEKHDLPRIVSIQNEYNLVCRLFDTDMAEVSQFEQVGLLAFSPLAAGGLSGKYLGGVTEPGTRRAMQESLNGRYVAQSEAAIRLYADIAQRHGLNLAQMALAFCLTRPFMTSVIIGATDMDQLKTNIGSKDIQLSQEVLADIQQVYRDHPRPI